MGKRSEIWGVKYIIPLFYYVTLLAATTQPGPYKDALTYFRDKLESNLENDHVTSEEKS